jgi:hypothetical protein
MVKTIAPMLMSSSGSPGSWPSQAADIRCLITTLRSDRKTSKYFPETDYVLRWGAGPSGQPGPVLLCVAHDPGCACVTSRPARTLPVGKRAIGEILTLLTGSNTTET